MKRIETHRSYFVLLLVVFLKMKNKRNKNQTEHFLKIYSDDGIYLYKYIPLFLQNKKNKSRV